MTLKQILDAGGVELQPYVFKEADSGRGLAEKVRLKGSMADRVKVRSKAKKSAKVVAEVPGGMEYTVIEKNGNWYRIELIDGKSGFVSDKAVE